TAVCPPAHAQVVTVSIQGRVYDTSGAAISQATVTAVNPATGLTRTTTASATGDYQITLLPPGDYTVTAEKSGFQTSAKKLDLGQHPRHHRARNQIVIRRPEHPL